jgi:hypothetical protein
VADRHLVRRTIQELKKRGEEIERNPLGESILYQIAFIQRWQPAKHDKPN